MGTKYFTLEEANHMLPELDKQLQYIQNVKMEFREKYTRLRRLTAISTPKIGARYEEQFMLECELDFIQIEARSYMDNFYRLGVEVKDVDLGLIDFPAQLDGEDVLLCWRQGEQRIAFYHSKEDGFAGRRRLPE
ncbi:DUF2203 domain-containing protein [Paenibacillus sp. N1-5-1-14]|uniref:DUF2203 domain-containing protein n=1 Tax=Paenibacillus radicibacter TaxID=2972488 RepID=UPI002159286E|nr:DUF2203 domain-containing protein [Paenibacillus radicibacter]MCR8644936.1 DUF2203 domain-containing protein [Paenibacillus radicibacter]